MSSELFSLHPKHIPPSPLFLGSNPLDFLEPENGHKRIFNLQQQKPETFAFHILSWNLPPGEENSLAVLPVMFGGGISNTQDILVTCGIWALIGQFEHQTQT